MNSYNYIKRLVIALLDLEIISWSFIFTFHYIGDILLLNIYKKKFEDTKGVIKSLKSKKDRQYNDQKKKDKQRSTKHYT